MSLPTTAPELDAAHQAAADLWERWLVMWNDDAQVAYDILGPGYRVHMPNVDAVFDTTTIRDATAMATWVIVFTGKFENLRYETELGPIVDGDLAVVRWRGTAICRGLTAWPRDVEGEPITFAGVDILRIADGRIVEVWTQGTITENDAN